MEPIKINVSVELNLSQDVKNFLASIMSNVVANHAAPVAPAVPAAPTPVAPTPAPTAPVASAAPAPVPVAPTAPTASTVSISIEQVRQALAAKINGHREEIKAKLNSLGAPSVTKLNPAKYSEMLTFLNSL